MYASDYPYGGASSSLLIALHTARLAGLDEDDIRGMLGGNANGIADGSPPREPTAPRGPELLSQPLALARMHQYLTMATPLLWTRQPDTIGALGLALNACEGRERGGAPDELDRIRELLLVARDLWARLPEPRTRTRRGSSRGRRSG